MRVLIVDDEAPARAKLVRMLSAQPDVEIVGEAADGIEALAQLGALAPDVLFIDVQMPEVDGFDVVASLPGGAAPAVVFVTAFDHYALRAFEAQAVDYLLKPVEPERLERTLQRLRADGNAGATRSAAVGLARPPTQLLIPERGRTRIVRCAEIDWLEAADNYVELHLGNDRTLLMRRPFAALLDDLGPAFVRTHRGAAVAIDRVRELRPRGKGDAVVVLASGVELPCSRAYRAGLRDRLRQSG